MHHRPWSTLAAGAAALLAAAPVRAELELPRRTIVVRDFARRRQDLLDTLRVNLPGSRVEIAEFRGAEVVLEVTLESEEPVGDLAAAEEKLRRHCDRLIRQAFRGMRLAPASAFVFRTPDVLPPEEQDLPLVDRLRTALSRVGVATPGDADPVLPAPGEEPALDTGAEHRYQQLLEEKREEAREEIRAELQPPPDLSLAMAEAVAAAPTAAEVPDAEVAPPPAAEDPAHLVPERVVARKEVSPAIARAMQAYPPKPAPKPTGKALEHLRGQAARADLLGKLEASREVSPEALAAMKDFQERGGMAVSSQKTVKGIYEAIFASRAEAAASPAEDAPVDLKAPVSTRSAPAAGPPAAARAAAPPPLADPFAPPVAPSAAPAAAAPAAPPADDTAFGHDLEALFASAGRAP